MAKTNPEHDGSLSAEVADILTNSPVQSTGNETGRKPRIAFFIPNLSVGGAEQVTINIVNGLAARGYEVDLLLSKYEGELQSQLSEQVNVKELPPSHTTVFGVAAHLPALCSYLKTRKPAVLFPQMAHVSIVPLALDRILDTQTKIVPTHHTGYGTSKENSPKGALVERLYPRLYPAADRIVAVSEGIADDIVEKTAIKREDISVIHNPVYLETVREQSR